MPTIAEIRAQFPSTQGKTDLQIVEAYSQNLGQSMDTIAYELGVELPKIGGNTGAAWESGKAGYKAGFGNIAAAVGESAGLKGLKTYGENLRDDMGITQQYADSKNTDATNFDDVHSVADFGGYVRSGAMKSLPYMAEAIAFAAADGITGGALTPAILETYAARAAARFGAAGIEKQVVASGASNLATQAAAREAATKSAGRGLARTAMMPVVTAPSSLGDVLGNQYEEAGKYDLESALPAAAGYAALNAIGLEGALARGMPVSMLNSRVARTASGAATLGVQGAAQETAQEVMNQAGRMGVNPDATLTSGDALERYKESAILGGILEGAPAAITGAISKSPAAKNAATAAALSSNQDVDLLDAAQEDRTRFPADPKYVREMMDAATVPGAPAQEVIDDVNGVATPRPSQAGAKEAFKAKLQNPVVLPDENGKAFTTNDAYHQYLYDNNVPIPADKSLNYTDKTPAPAAEAAATPAPTLGENGTLNTPFIESLPGVGKVAHATRKWLMATAEGKTPQEFIEAVGSSDLTEARGRVFESVLAAFPQEQTTVNNANLGITANRDGSYSGGVVEGKTVLGEGSESTVYRDGNKVIKVSEPYSDKSEETYNERVANTKLVNTELGDGSIQEIGHYESANGTKNPVFSQDYVEGRPATKEEVKTHMEGRGYKRSKEGKYADEYTKTVDGVEYTARDLDGDNVRVTSDGVVKVIDATLTKKNVDGVNTSVERVDETAKGGQVSMASSGIDFAKIATMLAPQQKKIFDVLVSSSQNFEMDDVISGDGKLQYQKIAEKAGLKNRGAAQAAINQTIKKISDLAGVDVKQFLADRTKAVRSTEASGIDNIGLSPAKQASVVGNADVFGNEEESIDPSMGVIKSVGATDTDMSSVTSNNTRAQDEVMKQGTELLNEAGALERGNVKVPEGDVAPSENAIAAAKAGRQALVNQLLESPESRNALLDWDIPGIKIEDFTEDAMISYLSDYIELVESDMFQEASSAEQNRNINDLQNEIAKELENEQSKRDAGTVGQDDAGTARISSGKTTEVRTATQAAPDQAANSRGSNAPAENASSGSGTRPAKTGTLSLKAKTEKAVVAEVVSETPKKEVAPKVAKTSGVPLLDSLTKLAKDAKHGATARSYLAEAKQGQDVEAEAQAWVEAVSVDDTPAAPAKAKKVITPKEVATKVDLSQDITATIEAALTIPEQVRVEEHYKQDADEAFVSFQEELADWIIAGAKDASHKLADLFAKVLKAMQQGVMSFAVMVNLNPVALPNLASLDVPVSTYSVKQVIERPKADFGSVNAPASVKLVADWQRREAPNKPVIIVDKQAGIAYVVDAKGKLIAKTPALTGKAVGDIETEAAKTKSLDDLSDADKVTPAGVFQSSRQVSDEYGEVVNVTGNDKFIIAIHRTYLGTPSEMREARLASPTSDDNRVSFGCINVPASFYDNVIINTAPSTGTFPVVIMPETTSVESFFPNADFSSTETITTEVTEFGSNEEFVKEAFSPSAAKEENAPEGSGNLAMVIGAMIASRSRNTSATLSGPSTRKVAINDMTFVAAKMSTKAHPEVWGHLKAMYSLGYAEALKQLDGVYIMPSEADMDGAVHYNAASGTYSLYLNEDIISGKTAIKDFVSLERTIYHEVAHVLDDVAHDQIYSNDIALTDRGAVGNELAKKFVTNDWVKKTFMYPMDKYYGLSGLELQSEIFPQIMSAYHNPKLKAGLLANLPQAYMFAKDAHDEIKRSNALFSGTNSTAQSGSQSQSQTTGQGRTDSGQVHASKQENDTVGKEYALKKLYRLAENSYDEYSTPDEAYDALFAAANDKEKSILRALKRDDFLGFDYPHQAVYELLENPDAYDVTPSTKGQVTKAGNKVFATHSRKAARQVGGTTGEMIYDDTTHALKKAFRGLVFLHDLVDEYKDRLPAIKDWYAAVQNSLSTRKQLEGDAEQIATDANTLKNGTEAVNAFISASTYEQKWGYDPQIAGLKVVVDPAMRAKFVRLSAEEQKVVKDVFAHGRTMNAAKLAILKGLGIGQEFTSTGVLEGPYAPLKRFGNFLAVLKSKELRAAETAGDTKLIEKLKASPDHYIVSAFDSMSQAKQFAQANDVTGGGKFQMTDAFEKSARVNEDQVMPPAILAKVLAAVKVDDNMPTTARDAMTKLVTDMYFQTLDEHNARTSGLKRLNRAGYDTDMIRSFLSHARAEAGFLANMKFGGEINTQFYKMQATAKDQASGKRVSQDEFNVIAQHYAESLKYNETPWQDRAMALTSAWQLATSVGYHLTNAMQGIMVTIPKLGADFNNYSGAWDHLMRAYGTLKTTGIYGAPNLAAIKDTNIREMLQHASDMGVLDVGMDEDLTHFEATRTGINPVDNTTAFARNALHRLRKVSRAVETANRVSSAVAGYNMSIEAGKSVADAKAYAIRILQTTQGDFSRIGAPLLLKKLPKIVTQYRKYQFMMGALYVKAFRDAFYGADANTKAIGRRLLAYKMFHTSVAAGALGMPLMNLVSMAFAALGDDDEPKDLERSLKDLIGNDDLATLLLHGPIAMMGLDMSGKLGDDKIFSIMPYGEWDFSSKAGMLQTVAGLAGPAVSQFGKFADGVGLVADGDYYKSLEKFMPKGIESGMKAFRIANEGYTLRNGDVMFDAEGINGFALVMDSLGVPSSELKKMDFIRSQQYEISTFYKDRTTEIQHAYNKAYHDKDVAEMKELRDEWLALQKGKDNVRPYFNNARTALKRQPLSNLLKYPQAVQKRSKKVEGETPESDG